MAGNIKYSSKDRLSRFIRHKGYVAKTKNRVKPAAFMPDPHRTLSMFHTQNLKKSQIWPLADANIHHDIQMRADIPVLVINEIDLSIDWNYKPKYHVDIIGWTEKKDDRLAKALELANHSELKFRKTTTD